MRSQESVDALIVGTGPTGLVMAAELARRGIRFRAVDIAREPTDLSKAIGIQARTLEILGNMGLAAQFTAAGNPATGVHMYAEGRQIVHLTFDGLDTPFPYLLLLAQSETERILFSHVEALGGVIERGVRMERFVQDADGVTATLHHPDGSDEEVRASWLIGCDGAHSTVRHGLGLPFEGEEYEEGFVLADVRVDWPQAENELYIFLHEGWLLALFPLGQGRYRMIADVPPEQAPLDQEPTLEACQALVDERVTIKARLSDPRWKANYRIHRRIVSKLREGRAFLVGDAAHIHSPAGAQGMNTGIQDGFNLAWKLALVVQGRAEASLLDSYHAERYPVEQGVLRGTDALLKIASLRPPLAQTVRNALAPLLTGLRPVRETMRENISEIAVGYSASPIVGEDTSSIQFRTGPGPGDRAPDVSLTRESGDMTTLFDLLRGPAHTLLLVGDDPLFAAFTEDTRTRFEGLIQTHRVDAGAEIRQRYAAHSPCLFLIRPDGYIGYRAQPPDLEKFHHYLKATFGFL